MCVVETGHATKGGFMKEKDLKTKLKEVIKKKDYDTKQAINAVLSEVTKLNKKKGSSITEEDIHSIIKDLVKSEMLVLGYSGVDESKSKYLGALKSFLQVS